MKKRKRCLPFSGMIVGFLVVYIIVTLTWTTTALAKRAYISDVVVTNTRDYLLVYFSVKDCFTIEMNRAIESGIDTTFTFFIQLFKTRDYWRDRKIADIKLSHSIKYNTLKRVYTVRLPERNDEPITVGDFEEARKLMAEIVALKVTPLHNLKKGRRYTLRMKAELDTIRLPLYLHRVLFFLSLWDFKTDWKTELFRY